MAKEKCTYFIFLHIPPPQKKQSYFFAPKNTLTVSTLWRKHRLMRFCCHLASSIATLPICSGYDYRTTVGLILYEYIKIILGLTFRVGPILGGNLVLYCGLIFAERPHLKSSIGSSENFPVLLQK